MVTTLVGGVAQQQSPNPDTPNAPYCAAARLGSRPCNFWDLSIGGGGVACSPGASVPVNLTVNFFLYLICLFSLRETQ
eukprot:COSAG05_NODE_2957_length_2466_cov_2.106886_1_plen_78_part_00